MCQIDTVSHNTEPRGAVKGPGVDSDKVIDNGELFLAGLEVEGRSQDPCLPHAPFSETLSRGRTGRAEGIP